MKIEIILYSAPLIYKYIKVHLYTNKQVNTLTQIPGDELGIIYYGTSIFLYSKQIRFIRK